jgi:RimJ/RimL family protein N-acetyltransferase
MIASTIQTPRLTLLRLTDTSPGSQHVQFFHENWTDPDATAWSLHGPTKSIEESRDWLIEHLEKWDNLFYSVFIKPDENGGENDGLGEHIGSVSLRLQKSGATLPLPSEQAYSGKPIDLRVLGYALFKKAWGKGYATEANKALLHAYGESVAEEKKKGEKVFWVEVCVDDGNPGSRKVIEKLGMKSLGWKDEGEEKVWIAGEWRVNGVWVYGMEV